MPSPSNIQLQELARKRVAFRVHFVVYFLINAAFWIIWFATGKGYVWPVWPTVSWGVVVALHCIFDYHTPKFFSEEEEYKKLKKELERHNKISLKKLDFDMIMN